MSSLSRHPEAVAVAVIVLLLCAASSFERILATGACPCPDVGFAQRLERRLSEVGNRIAERMERLGERLRQRLGLRLESPRASLKPIL